MLKLLICCFTCVVEFSVLFIMHWAHGIEDANTLRMMCTMIYLILPLRGLCHKGTLLKGNLVEKKPG